MRYLGFARLAFVAFLLLLVRPLFAQEVEFPLDPTAAAGLAEPWVAQAARSHPWIVTALCVIGLLRTVFKSLRTALPLDSASNSKWTTVQTQTWYRVLAWLLDFGASIRIPVPPASRSGGTSAAGGIDRGAASLLALACVFLTACAVSGCASFKTTQLEDRDETNGTVRIETRVAARTLFTSKSQLTSFSAVQTEGKQGASVGSLSQQSSGTNAVRALEALDSILSKVR